MLILLSLILFSHNSMALTKNCSCKMVPNVFMGEATAPYNPQNVNISIFKFEVTYQIPAENNCKYKCSDEAATLHNTSSSWRIEMDRVRTAALNQGLCGGHLRAPKITANSYIEQYVIPSTPDFFYVTFGMGDYVINKTAGSIKRYCTGNNYVYEDRQYQNKCILKNKSDNNKNLVEINLPMGTTQSSKCETEIAMGQSFFSTLDSQMVTGTNDLELHFVSEDPQFNTVVKSGKYYKYSIIFDYNHLVKFSSPSPNYELTQNETFLAKPNFYNDRRNATSPNATLNYSITPSLPSGLSLNSQNGTISGKPTGALNQFTKFTVMIKDEFNIFRGSADIYLKIAPAVTTPSSPGTLGVSGAPKTIENNIK